MYHYYHFVKWHFWCIQRIMLISHSAELARSRAADIAGGDCFLFLVRVEAF